MSNSLLQIQNLQVDFVTELGTNTAINQISIEVQRGEIMALVGESGSGKSVTSLSILQLLPTPPAKYTSGKILFSPDGNEPIDLLKQDKKSMQRIRGNEIAMIFQEPMSSLNPVFTCGDQVMEAIRAHQKVSSIQAREKTIELFNKVQLPDPPGMFNRYPHQLSGGQKQRVMIAIAMSCKPALLICDEPTTALDVTVQKTILELIKALQAEEQMGVIFITHDLGVVAEIADKAAVMYKGNIVEQGTIAEIFSSAKHPYTKALLACRPALHPKGERLPVVSDFISEDETGMINTKLEVQNGKYEIRNTKKEVRNTKLEINEKLTPLIEVEGLKVWYPGKKNFLGRPVSFVKAVDDVSFVIYKGETLGLVGESGCGKTTLGRTVLRLIKPVSGRITYEGKDLSTFSAEELKKSRKDIQIIFQDPYGSLNPRLTIGSAIAEPLKVHGLYGNNRQRKEKVVELLEKVNLQADHSSRYPHEFSGGQRQRIVIARALALEPSFIVCDESVSALDVSVQAQVLNLLSDLRQEFGFTSVFISHDLSVVRYISDRILVMNQGKIVEIGEAEKVYSSPENEYTRKLLNALPGKKVYSL